MKNYIQYYSIKVDKGKVSLQQDSILVPSRHKPYQSAEKTSRQNDSADRASKQSLRNRLFIVDRDACIMTEYSASVNLSYKSTCLLYDYIKVTINSS